MNQKPTPVITPIMVTDNPSRYSPNLGVKSPTDSHVQSGTDIACCPLSKTKNTDKGAHSRQPHRPTPMMVAGFFANSALPHGQYQNPIKGENKGQC